MLSRPLYEALPYGYLLAAALTLWLTPVGFAHLFAFVLFAAGACIWIIRSNARRADRRRSKPKPARIGGSLFVSFPSYECYPFAIMALALWLMATGQGVTVIVLGAVVLGYSLWILAQRSSRRGHGWMQLGGSDRGMLR